MKNILIYLLFSVFVMPIMAQNKGEVALKWKILPNETLTYTTVMAAIDSATIVPTNFPIALLPLIDSAKIQLAKDTNKLTLRAEPPTHFTTLTAKKQGIIAVNLYDNINRKQLDELHKNNLDMVAREEQLADISKNPIDATWKQRMLQMPDSIAKSWSGTVYETGGIHSFYMTSGTKNMLALFFELPKKSIKIGDSWALDVHFLSFPPSKERVMAFQRNNVTLTALKKQGDDTIAVIEYDLIESVTGKILMIGEGTSSMCYKAIGEFSMNKGRWVSYNGILHTKTDTQGGWFGNSATSQLFVLQAP